VTYLKCRSDIKAIRSEFQQIFQGFLSPRLLTCSRLRRTGVWASGGVVPPARRRHGLGAAPFRAFALVWKV